METADLIAKKDAHRQEVLKELIATEKDYIRDLGIIVNLYMEPLQNEHKALIKPNEFQSVFSTINMLPPLNQELVGKLEKTKELPPGDQIVGGVFLEMVRNCLPFFFSCASDFFFSPSPPQHPYFKLYMGYCTNHAASLSTLKKLKNNGAFAAFIEEVRQKPECRKLDIEAYLIKPLQRICRYPLLLKVCVHSLVFSSCHLLMMLHRKFIRICLGSIRTVLRLPMQLTRSNKWCAK